MLTLWLCGVLWSLARLAFEGQRASLLRRECRDVPDEEARLLLSELCARLRVRRAPMLLRSVEGGPLLMGLIRPAIVLPAPMLSQSTRDELKLVLAHEAAHLKRRDLLWNLILTLACVLFWFHPLRWLARREWRLAVEQACDELALAATQQSAASYGALLLKVAARLPAQAPALVSVGVAEDYALLQRRIAALGRAGQSSKRAVRLGSALLLGAAVVGLVPWRVTALEAAPQASDAARASTSAASGSGAAVELVGSFEQGSAALSLAFSPEGKRLASTSGGSRIELWQVEASGLRREKTLAATAAPHTISQIAFGKGGQVLAAVSDRARLWDVSQAKVLAALQVADPTPAQQRRYGQGFGVAVAVSPDGKMVASTGQFLIVHARQADGTWKKVLQEKFYYGIGLAFTPDGKSLIEAGHNGRLFFWSASKLRAGRAVMTSGLGHRGSTELHIGAMRSRPDAAQEPEAFNNPMSGLALSPEGAWLGTSHVAFTQSIYARPLPTSGPHTFTVRQGELLVDGKRRTAIKKRIPSSIVLRDGRSGQFSRVLEAPSNINALAFSPNGRVVAGACDDGIRFWEAASGRLLHTLSEIKNVRALAFSPDGRLLASGGGDRSVRLWRLSAGLASRIATMRSAAQMSPALAPTGQKVEVEVLSPSGQPVLGARALWTQLDENNQERIEAFTTDARGRFLFPIGRVRRGDDFVHQAVLWVLAPGFGATRYDITPPRTDEPEVIRLRRASTLRLSLRDSRRRPLPRIDIEVSRLSSGDEALPVGYRSIYGAATPGEVLSRLRSRTDARGQAVIAGLPQGVSVELDLSYASPGDNSAHGKYLRARPSRFAPLESEGKVLMSQSLVSRAITMLAPAVVRGRVTFADGSPVVGAVITPSNPEAGQRFGFDLPRALTNAQGRYSMGGLRPGAYAMKVSRGKKLEHEWAVVNARAKVREGNTNRVDLKLVPGAIIQGRVVSVRTGRGVAGQPLGFRDAAQNYGYKKSGPDGSFEFRSVGGEQRLWLRSDADSPPGFSLPVETNLALAVANGQSKSITFRLPSVRLPRAITGQVLGQDNRPVEGASVSVEGLGGTPRHGLRALLKTDARGRFSISPNITARPVRLWASAGTRMSARGAVAISGDAVTLRIGEGNQAAIGGRVLDTRSRRPIIDARVALIDNSEDRGSQIASAKSDAAGRFRFEGLRPGSIYSLSAEARGYEGGYEDLASPRVGQSVPADILMRRRGSFVAGRVLYPNGKPVAGVRIAAMGFATPATSDAQGRFRINNVAPGPLDVMVTAPGWREPTWMHLVGGRSDGRITILPPRQDSQQRQALNARNRARRERRRALPGSMAPEIRARGWVNSPPLSLASLRGQVVLLEFLPFSAQTVRPEVEEIARDFTPRGLRVIGIQDAPEYRLALQRDINAPPEPPVDLARLSELSRRLGLTYALALDSPPATAPGAQVHDATLAGPTAQAYNNARHAVIDRAGRIAYVGESLGAAMSAVADLLGTS